MKEFKENFNLKDWKVQLWALIICLIAEMISKMAFTVGGAKTTISFSLLPMFFAIVLGIVFASAKKIDREMMDTASPYIALAVGPLTVACCYGIGPAWDTIKSAGLAVVLQEFGNVCTCLLAIPVGVLVFKMGRAAVGAGFSISREDGIAIVSERYGLDSDEGIGVMGAYITGTVLGTVFCGIMVSLFSGIGVFHPYAMAMAAGTGSASMMAAQLAPLVDAFPAEAEAIKGFAAASQTLTNIDGLYMDVFVSIPLAELIYKVCAGKKAKKEAAK